MNLSYDKEGPMLAVTIMDEKSHKCIREETSVHGFLKAMETKEQQNITLLFDHIQTFLI